MRWLESRSGIRENFSFFYEVERERGGRMRLCIMFRVFRGRRGLEGGGYWIFFFEGTNGVLFCWSFVLRNNFFNV